MSKKLTDGILQKDHILFKEKEHEYVNVYTDELYTSATTVIALYKGEFDSEKALDRVAKKRLIDKYKNTPPFLRPNKTMADKELQSIKDKISKRWEYLKNIAGDFGTAVHAVLEDYYTGEDVSNNKYKKILDNYTSKFGPTPEGDIVLLEELLYSDKYKIAGLADKIIVHSDGTFSVEDYKTNKTFDRFAYNSTDLLFAPFNELQNCHLSIYTIQLNIYSILFEDLTGMKPRELNIYWYNRLSNVDVNSIDTKEYLNDYDNISGDWEKIPCEFMRDKTLEMLKTFNKLKKKQKVK